MNKLLQIPKRTLVGIIILAVVMVVIIANVSNNSASSQVGKAKYTAVVKGTSVIDPATLMVRIQVDNVGDAAGKPSCTVRADSTNHTYKGFEIFTSKDEIKPYDLPKPLAGSLTITKEGAEFVTGVTVDCE